MNESELVSKSLVIKYNMYDQYIHNAVSLSFIPTTRCSWPGWV